ncbi:hypothetical protein [Streptomyces sp. NPDC005336]|uniref:hypothetical protein n=1 Tax=Streptomyces sp. NPDC005336 TaxID=3157035 RepID=UPI0033A3417C
MPAPSDTSTTTNAFSWRFVTPLLTGSAINAINSSLIATALVPIAAAVHVSVGRTAVLVSALYLAGAARLPSRWAGSWRRSSGRAGCSWPAS